MNRLQTETSPYLLQHADNPVDWYPWGEEALAAARRENKPILLSIGYSACHWCHVMAHESFADPATAEVMNRLFINIKVDREERPDIDKIYQTAHQLITRRGGGWPLTVFLTPAEQLPFFAGTYFPNEARYGMPAFADLLLQVAQHYAAHRDDIHQQATAVVHALGSLEAGQAGAAVTLDQSLLQSLRQQLGGNFDSDWGGFGDAPKFPHVSSMEFLLRHWRASAHSEEPDVQALFMVALTLTRMIEGGIYDQLGGGFFRYAVDREWRIPHFEKMLYDNGPLLTLLTELWQASGDDTFRQAASETADWVLRDMRSDAGGFFATLDADSQGEEGKFYVWTPTATAALLDDKEYAVLACRYGLDQAANFEGAWHLQVRNSLEQAAAAAGEVTAAAVPLLNGGRAKLLAHRNQRVWPARDEKILTAWNALMIKGLAAAARRLERPELTAAALAALTFVRQQLYVDGRLLAVYKDGQARFNAYLDDYAFLLDASIEVLQNHWDSGLLQFAIELADGLLDDFADSERGGFYFTGRQHEKLVHRSRTFSDDSLPSGNGIAALALNRLGHLLAEPRYLSAAENTLRAAAELMADFPHGHASMIIALDEYLDAPEIFVIRGSADAAGEWAHTIAALYAPHRLIFAIPDDAGELPGALAQRAPAEHTVAYHCKGTRCGMPITSREALLAAVKES